MSIIVGNFDKNIIHPLGPPKNLEVSYITPNAVLITCKSDLARFLFIYFVVFV